ncbi:MAG: hypothetical protein AB7L13_14895 [Acidimicrobiia bacterium]
MRCDDRGRDLHARGRVALLFAVALALTIVGALSGRLTALGATVPPAAIVHGAPPIADRFELPPPAPRLAVGVRQGSLRSTRWVEGAAASILVSAGLVPPMAAVLPASPVPDRGASAMLGLRRRGPPVASL